MNDSDNLKAATDLINRADTLREQVMVEKMPCHLLANLCNTHHTLCT